MCVKVEDEYVYTASGELVEYTFDSYEKAYEELTKYDAWGVVLKHKRYSFYEEPQPEEVVYEHLPYLKP